MPVRERHPRRDGGAEEPPDGAELGERYCSVPRGSRSPQRDARPPRARAFRDRCGRGRDDDEARGKDTTFLPFNQGHSLSKGNPPNPRGHKTSYLWERVWEKDAWLDLIHLFIHVERPEKGSPAARRAAEKVIFPRYHQWDAVLKLEADAVEHGAGRFYLIQHSAGSGKSNTIAWGAHRLSTLHTAGDRKVFDKVIVITDRVILDKQPQETIYQFEHARGVVVKIDKDSGQLAQALEGEQARIIITTLQKFPFVLEKVGALPARSYAVVIDEAHSSQTGESAKALRLALGTGEEQALTAAEAEDIGLRHARRRGRRPQDAASAAAVPVFTAQASATSSRASRGRSQSTAGLRSRTSSSPRTPPKPPLRAARARPARQARRPARLAGCRRPDRDTDMVRTGPRRRAV